MDEQNQRSLDWEPYVWRGALGGAIGTLVVLLVGAAASAKVEGALSLALALLTAPFNSGQPGTIWSRHHMHRMSYSASEMGRRDWR